MSDIYDDEDNAFFDLHKKITTDTKFAERVEQYLKYIHKADVMGKFKERDKATENLLRECRYNPSCLVPMFFPKFNNNKPMSLWSRPHAIAMMSIAPNASITIQSSRQIGKCLTGDTMLHCKIGDEEADDITIQKIFELSE